MFLFLTGLLVGLVATGISANAATNVLMPGEMQLFNACRMAYQDGFYERTEAGIREFLQKYPNSRLRSEIRLLRGQTLFRMEEYEEALQALEPPTELARELRDQFLYWQAEVYLQMERYEDAARRYEQLTADFPDSELYMPASYQAALARFQLGQYSTVIALLEDKGRPFYKAKKRNPDHHLVTQGRLLLVQALLQQGQQEEALDVLADLEEQALGSEDNWRVEYLRARAYLVDGQTERALQLIPDLMERARQSRDPANLAETHAFHAELLEHLGRPEDALYAYENNLSAEIPESYRRQALLQVIESRLATQQMQPAILRLERFIQERPQDELIDLVRLTLGELYLRQYLAQADSGQNPGASTSSGGDDEEEGGEVETPLDRARRQFQTLIAENPTSLMVGKAWLELGWCEWEAEDWDAARQAFRKAVLHNPRSNEQATAALKLAEIDLRQSQLDSAQQQFQNVVDEYASYAEIDPGTLARARASLVEIAIRQGNLTAARKFLGALRAYHPNTETADRSTLEVAQAELEEGAVAEARSRIHRLIEETTHSSLLPIAHMLLAESYFKEQRWQEALDRYDTWLSAYENHPLAPKMEFDRSWATWLSGDESTAQQQFEEFLKKYPAHPLGAQTQLWLGNHFFRQGNYVEAEKHFEHVFTRWPDSEVAPHAILLAGLAAISRQGYNDARNHYLRRLIENAPHVRSDSNIPPEIAIEAFFAYADSFILEPAPADTDPVERFNAAIKTLNPVVKNYPDHPLVPLAKSRLASYYFQYAARNPSQYDVAIELYREVLSHEDITATVRSQSEVGLALALEKKAQSTAASDPALRQKLMAEAMTTLESVFYGFNLKGTPPDPFWISKAGLELARISTDQGDPEKARRIYRRMQESFPALSRELQQRLAGLRPTPEESLLID